MPSNGRHRRQSQGDPTRGVSQRNAEPGRGKKQAKRAIRAFFLWGRTIWRGRLITTTAELAGTFEGNVIREVRQQVAHLRLYWTGLEGTGVTRDDTVAELCRYDQDLENEIERRSRELNQEEWISIASEERIALKEQIMQIRSTDPPVYEFLAGLKNPARTARHVLSSLL